MRSENVLKTTFQTSYGHYEFLVISFVLMNAPTTFMDIMNMVTQNYLDSFVIIFIDDIFIYSKNEGEHMTIWDLDYMSLRNTNYFPSIASVSFGCDWWHFLFMLSQVRV